MMFFTSHFMLVFMFMFYFTCCRTYGRSLGALNQLERSLFVTWLPFLSWDHYYYYIYARKI